MKAHYKRAKIVVTLYYFSMVPCLNFNYVIIMKDFHNVFTYYDKAKPKEIKCHTNYIFISYDMMLKYICTKNDVCHNLLKKQKYN